MGRRTDSGSETEDLPAFVRDDLAGRGGGGQPLYDRLWGSGFLPSQLSGREVPLGRATRCCICRIPQGFTADDRRQFLDALGELNQMAARGVRRSGDRHAHRAVRDGVPDADVGAGADGPFEGARAHLRAVRPGCAQARHLRRQLPAGAPAGRARRALHPALPSRLGPPRQPARRICRSAARRPTSASAGADCGSEAARHAGRYAGGLGRRIRAHGLLPGPADRDGLRARPSSALLHDVDGGRRR